MSRWRRAGDRLRDSWERGGITQVGKELRSYLAWRFAGSPGADTSADHVAMRLNDLEAAVGILLHDQAVRALVVDPGTRISIVLPTRNRKHLLRRAIDSVLAQSYPNWELVVVDNSDDPIGTISDDRRVRVLRLEAGSGASRARNLGLAEATGDVITFLDDDNEMAPDWLKAVAHAFQTNPGVQVVIGAQIVQPEPGANRAPSIRYRMDFDWETLTQYNYVDLGMLAHRYQPDLKFDETLPAFLDWDYVVRLTADHEPLVIPALSGTYHTDATERISYQYRRGLIDELRTRFSSIPRTGRPDVADLTRDDLGALDFMFRRVAENLGRPSVTLITVDSLASLAKMFGPDLAHWSLTASRDAGPYDLVIVGPEGPHTLPRLSEPGIVVGIKANVTDYPSRFPELAHNRRVGDQLWVGSPQPMNPENLFPGAALVKLGHDKPDDTPDGE